MLLLIDCINHFEAAVVFMICLLDVVPECSTITLDAYFALNDLHVEPVGCRVGSADDGHSLFEYFSTNANAMTTFPIREIVAMSVIVVVKIVKYFVCCLCRGEDR